MKHKEFDVIIVGGGPAGLIAAKELGKNRTVALVERKPFPLRKSCGGLLAKNISQLIPEWDDNAEFLSSPRLLNIEFRDLDNGRNCLFNQQFWNIERSLFSQWLLERLPKDVTVLKQTSVRGIQAGKDIAVVAVNPEGETILNTEFIIGADGARSFVRKAMDIPPVDFWVTFQEVYNRYVYPDDTARFVFSDELFPEFYAWIIPKGDEVIIGSSKAFYKTIHENWELIVGRRGERLRYEGGLLTRLSSVQEICYGKDRCLLAGEAGGMVSPISGEGFSFAFLSGLNAAQAILSNPNNALDKYRESCSELQDRLENELQALPFLQNSFLREAFGGQIMGEGLFTDLSGS